MKALWTMMGYKFLSKEVGSSPEQLCVWHLRFCCPSCGTTWASVDWVEADGIQFHKYKWIEALCNEHSNAGRLFTPYTRLYIGDNSFPKEILTHCFLTEYSRGKYNDTRYPLRLTTPRP